MIVSIDSCLASSIKPQVLMMTTSAFFGSSVRANPSVTKVPSMISESTWFFEQPRFTKPMVVFLLFGREGTINREDMGSSLRDGSKACQSCEQRGIADVMTDKCRYGTHRIFSSFLLPWRARRFASRLCASKELRILLFPIRGWIRSRSVMPKERGPCAYSHLLYPLRGRGGLLP